MQISIHFLKLLNIFCSYNCFWAGIPIWPGIAFRDIPLHETMLTLFFDCDICKSSIHLPTCLITLNYASKLLVHLHNALVGRLRMCVSSSYVIICLLWGICLIYWCQWKIWRPSHNASLGLFLCMLRLSMLQVPQLDQWKQLIENIMCLK